MGPKQRGTRGLTCWLLIARFYFISFLQLDGSARGSSGFDGHVSLLVLIGLSYSGQCVLMRKFCDRMVMMIIEYLVIKNKKKNFEINDKKIKRIIDKIIIRNLKIKKKMYYILDYSLVYMFR